MTNPLMFDGIAGDAAAIHAAFPNAPMVGGYVDGNFEWTQEDWDLFPNAKHVRISAIPGSANALTADVADCETGDYTAEEAASWARAKKAAGYDRPTIYCNLSTAPEVRAATGNMILGQDYDMWAADPTGTPHKVTFSDGRSASVTQFKFATFYDASESYDSGWPHRTKSDPAPPPPDNDGPVRHVIPNGNTMSLDAWCAARGATRDHIVDVSMANLSAAHQTLLTGYLTFDTVCTSTPGVNNATMPTGMVLYSES